MHSNEAFWISNVTTQHTFCSALRPYVVTETSHFSQGSNVDSLSQHSNHTTTTTCHLIYNFMMLRIQHSFQWIDLTDDTVPRPCQGPTASQCTHLHFHKKRLIFLKISITFSTLYFWVKVWNRFKYRISNAFCISTSTQRSNDSIEVLRCCTCACECHVLRLNLLLNFLN